MRRRRSAAASLLSRATHNLEEVRAAGLAREEEARAAADEARREAEFQAHLDEIARTEGGGKLAPPIV